MSDSTKTIVLGVAIFVIACCIAGVAVVFLFLPNGPAANAPSPIPGLAVGAWYQTHFTEPKYPDRASDHRGGLDEKLTALINTARSSVDIAIYQLDLQNVTQALLDASRRGVAVRVVTDVDILEDSKENRSFKELENGGIRVVGGNPNAIMHDKFVVIDRAIVWTGSWNFTDNDTYRYNNNGVLIQSRELAHNYTVTFEKMFTERKFSGARKASGTVQRLTIEGAAIENYFAPEDKVSGKIIARVKQATQSIDLLAFSFTDDGIGQAILERAKSGVLVRGVFEKTGSETQYSEYGRMRKAGLDVWQDGNPYLMHHKVIIVDGKTVILGSYNFSANADTENDENLLIVDETEFAESFEAEFTRIYEQAKAPPRK